MKDLLGFKLNNPIVFSNKAFGTGLKYPWKKKQQKSPKGSSSRAKNYISLPKTQDNHS